MRKLRNGMEIGAWMMTCNPKVWDLPGYLASGVRVGSWRLAANYRAGLVERGDRCFLWVGDSTKNWPSGVWATGIVSDRARLGEGDPGDPYWLDQAERAKERPYVGLFQVFLDPPILRTDLQDEEYFEGAEVLRMPRMGNPLVVTPDEVSVLDDYLAEYSGIPILRKLPAWGRPRRRDQAQGE